MTRVGIGRARIGPVCALPELLREFRVDPAAVIQGTGLDPRVFENPNANMAYRDFCRLLQACVTATGCGHFGLLLGQRAGLTELGNVAALARHAPDVMTALRDFETYLHVFDRACTVSLVVDGDTAIFSYAIIAPDLAATDQMYDMCLGITFNVTKELCGPGFRPSAVMLPHRPPPDPRIFKRFFNTAIIFDAEVAAVAFPATWLKQPPQCSDPALREAYLRAVVAAAAVTHRPVSERVRGLLCSGLPRRQCNETEIAASMSINVSTLRRRLQREGISFRQIVAETRYEVAKHFLLHSHVSLDRLSALLGYSEHSAFSRAFRTWAGMAPKAWQLREHQQPSIGGYSVTASSVDPLS